jgi:SNF2 family DNA or RNA helicase
MSIRTYRIDDGPLWGIKASYFSKALVAAAKSVPGMHFDRPSLSWQGYLDAVTAVAARLVHAGIGVDTTHLATPEEYTCLPILFSVDALRPYQVEGVQFCLARASEGALLADAPRLGKSCQATTAARALKGKTLVVCPSHAVGVWGRPPDAPEGPGEIAKWWPTAWDSGVVLLETVKPYKSSQIVLQGAKAKLKTKEYADAVVEQETFIAEVQHAQVIVCHYDILYAWAEILKAWGVETLILDELHICAGYQSRRSDCLKDLSKFAKYVIGLTGTPITNRPKNLHNILDILAQGRFGYFFGEYRDDNGEIKIRPGCYANLYCDSKLEEVGKGLEAKTVWNHKGRSNLDTPDGTKALTQEETLSSRMKFIMLRRLKKDVDPQLPQKQRQIIDVRIPPRKQFVIGSDMLTGKNSKELRECLNMAADGKLKSVVDILVGHLEEEEKVICFCYRRQFVEQVAADVRKKASDNALIDFVHGGITNRETRDAIIHSIRRHDGPALLVGTIDTISTAIDLSFASNAVVAELTWEPHELEQLEERVYKFGSENKAIVQYIIARGTGDELILRAVISKLDTFERVIGSTGDRMKEDLEGQKDSASGMKRLFAALREMQAKVEVNEPVTRRRKKR